MDLNILSLYKECQTYTKSDLISLLEFIRENSYLVEEFRSRETYKICVYSMHPLANIDDFIIRLDSIIEGCDTEVIDLSIDMLRGLRSVLSQIIVRLPKSCYTPAHFFKNKDYYVEVDAGTLSLSTYYDFKSFEVLNIALGDVQVVRANSIDACCLYYTEAYRRGINVVVLLKAKFRILRNKALLGG